MSCEMAACGRCSRDDPGAKAHDRGWQVRDRVGAADRPRDARACYVFAHGAGAGMTHAFMTDAAEGLAARGIATLRYQFPYMEKGGKRPDPPAVAQAAVRAAVVEAAHACPECR